MEADADDREDAHYFSDQPAAASDPVDIDVVLPDVEFTLRTDRAVFSRGRLDTGTAVLLRAELEIARSGDLLDLGCGTGPIGITMAMRAPEATVWAVDVNSRARELTSVNAERHGLTNLRVAAPDDVPDDVRFATIWSNPPIRIGKSRLHALLATWLGRLEPDGMAALVVQKHLGADSLQRWLNAEGFATTRVASKSGFRLLSVSPHR